MTSTALTPAEAAAAIVALINATPRTPWPEEIEAVIARAVPVAANATQVPAATLQDFAAYQQLCKAQIACPYGDLARGEPRYAPAKAVMDAIDRQRNELVARIWSRSPVGWHDVILRALIYANTGGDVENGAWVYTDADRYLQDHPRGNPHCETLALAFLMDAIFEVGGVRLPDVPRNRADPYIDFLDHLAAMEFPGAGSPNGERPTAAEIADAPRMVTARLSPLTLEVRRVRLLRHAAVAEELDAEKTPAYEAACAKSRRLDDEFEALAQRVRNRPVKSLDDVVMRAEVALQFNGGTLEELYDGCPHARAMSAVLAAVAVLGGCPLLPLDPELLVRKGELFGEHDVGWLECLVTGTGGSRPGPEVRHG